MPTIAEVRQKYPQYQDMSDRQLADALHTKFYADLPKADFDAKIGLKSAPSAAPPPKVSAAKDAAKSFGTGVNEGAAGVVGMFGDAAQLGSRVGEFAARQVGRVMGVPEDRLKPSARPVSAPGMPTSQGVNTLRQAVTGQDYQPQTEAGRVSRAVGRNALNVLVPGNPVQKVANVVAPALMGEGARYGVEKAGGGAGAQAVAEFVGSLAGGVGANVRIAPGAPKAPTAPKVSVDDLRPAKDAAYRVVDNAGVQYKPEAVNGLIDGVKAKFGGDVVDEVLHPKVARLINRMETYRDQPLTLTKIDQLRRGIRDNVFTATASKDERRLGYQLIDELDAFVTKAGPGDVMGGADPAGAAAALKSARDLNTRVSKIDNLQAARDRAVGRTGRTGSGGNVDNAIRQEVAKVRDRGRGWTPAERSALDSVESGGKVQNALRTFGKMSPSGNGLMQALNLGAAAKSGGMSIPVSLAAAGAKAVADGMTKAKVERVIQLVANGGTADAVELAGLASRDRAVAALVDQIKRVQIGGSSVNALTGRPSPQRLSPGSVRAPG